MESKRVSNDMIAAMVSGLNVYRHLLIKSKRVSIEIIAVVESFPFDGVCDAMVIGWNL